MLVCVDDEDEGEAHPRLSQPLSYQLSNAATVVESTVECKCFLLRTATVFHFPWNDSSIVLRVHWRQLGLVVPRHVALR